MRKRDDLMKPRVMILIDTYTIGGAGKVVLQFLRSGGAGICDPIVAGFWRGPQAPWQFREAVEGLDIKFEVLTQKFAFDPIVIRDALRLVKKNDIQILESHGYKGHVVCLVLKKITGLPWIAYTHGWTRENLKVAFYNSIDRNIVRFADRIIPVSKDLGRKLRLGSRAGSRMIVVNNAAESAEAETGTDNVRTQLGVKKDDVLIGVVGRLSPEKGHEYFLAAMRQLPSDLPVKAVFVGDGQEKERLSNTIRESGLEGKVMLVGYKADVAPFYRECDIIALPSLAEGMPNAALEAMAFGKPVVASAVGGIPEVVIDKQTGILVPPSNPEALAAALMRLAGDKLLMAKYGVQGKRTVEHDFSSSERVKKVDVIYRQVLSS
jgi:glycosyltransferase involved in cell wall biosynthesis